MSWFVIGVVLFALGILFSVCLHEAGHMLTAKSFGMKVTRYFVGFGPTLFSFRRGETEYGLKAIPAGGFVKITGMTPQDDDVEPHEKHRAFWSKPVWQKTIVLAAGSITHFILGFILLWVTAVFVGIPNQPGAPSARAEIGEVAKCVESFDVAKARYTSCRAGDPESPAYKAGLRSGDIITAVNGSAVKDWKEMGEALRADKENVSLTVERDGDTKTFTVTPVEVARPKPDATENKQGGVDQKDMQKTRVIGIGLQPTITVGAVSGVAVATDYTGKIFTGTFTALKKFPEKVPKLVDALMGEERDPETPVSVVGASVIGGEAAKAGLWPVFFFLLASLNIFIGIFNLFPLLPLDGGHIAIAWFERVRSWWAAKRGRPDPGRVNYEKLMPITYAVIIIFGGISLLTIATDIVNPISLYGP